MKKRLVVMLLGACMLAQPCAVMAQEAQEISAAAESQKMRAIITTDLECDDMNSLIHLSLFFNDVDVDGIVYSASQFHFVGDGEHTLSQVTPNFDCEGENAADLTVYRPMEIGWIENLWDNEYAEAYENLVKNDPEYPSPEYLKSITKVGNVAFEGDVREDTEGSNLIKNAILDEDERTLYLFSWGGFNTVARALLSIAEEYQETEEWQSIYRKVCDKVVISGYGQDNSFGDHIAELYPDLRVMNTSDGYAGYFTAVNGQEDSRYTFNSEWLTENIKFNHGSLMGKYGLMGDGTYYEGEPDSMQYGQTTTIDWGFLKMDFDQYDFLGEGDTSGFMSLIPVGLRGLETEETGVFGTWAGKISYETEVKGAADMSEMMNAGDVEYTDYNFVTGCAANSTKRYLLAFQEEWAARADWCVSGYEDANHAPVVEVETADFEAAPGEVVALKGSVADPDGDAVNSYWWIDEYTGTYSGDSKNLQVWNPISLETSFTVPADAAEGDVICVTLQAADQAEAKMTRYAQILIHVTAPAEEAAQ